MKAFRFSYIFAVFLFATVAIATLAVAPATGGPSKSYSPEHPPPIVLEKCIEVHRLLGPNPFSSIPNDYLLVTKYEEKPEGAVKVGLIPGRALNIYLVQGILLLGNMHTGIVHDSELVVKLSTINAKTSRETIREWILIDENGDQHIDRGIFRETVREKGKVPNSSKEIAIPRDRLQRLQAYYEKAALTLEARAGQGRSKSCVVT